MITIGSFFPVRGEGRGGDQMTATGGGQSGTRPEAETFTHLTLIQGNFSCRKDLHKVIIFTRTTGCPLLLSISFAT